MITEVFQMNTEVFQLKYGPPHTPDSSGILKYSHPSAIDSVMCTLCTCAQKANPFGMAVAYMVSAEQRTVEPVANVVISHSDICLNTPYFLRSTTPSQWCGGG